MIRTAHTNKQFEITKFLFMMKRTVRRVKASFLERTYMPGNAGANRVMKRLMMLHRHAPGS